MNERVGKFLLRKFNIDNYLELYNLITTELLIITKGSKGADFIFDNKIVSKKLINIEKEIDTTGAGDAFFSVIISEYINNNYKINKDMIEGAFNKATELTKTVISNIGAISHIIPLHKARRKNLKCLCEDLEIL